MFRRRHHKKKNGHMGPEASLAQAEAARRAQEQKHDKAQMVTVRIERLIEENDLAARFRRALPGGGAGEWSRPPR